MEGRKEERKDREREGGKVIGKGWKRKTDTHSGCGNRKVTCKITFLQFLE